MAPSSILEWPPPTAYDDMVTIVVGKTTTKTYRMHKGVLAFYSEYFDKALNGESQEAQAKEIKLPDTKTRVFDAVQNWMYSHQLHPPNVKDVKAMGFALIVEVWVFADAHIMPALQNATMDLLHHIVIETWVVPVTNLPYVYENTVEKSGLRLYCIDVVSKAGHAKELMTPVHEKYYPTQAKTDILRVVWNPSFKHQTKDSVKTWDLCKYHVHEEGVKCPQKSFA